MSIHVALNHRTHYRYDRPVALSPHEVRLRPAPHCRTPILSYSLKVEPEQHFLNWQQDVYGNFIARFVFSEKARELGVIVDLTADLAPINPFDFFFEPYAQNYPFTYLEPLAGDLAPFLQLEGSGPQFVQWLAAFRANECRSNMPTIEFITALNRRLHADIRYLVRLDPGVQTCEETLAKRSGSCRDSGWLLVQLLRHCGLGARFVSGYLIQLATGEPGHESDFAGLHAWAEVHVPGAGWIGLDPTSGLLATEGHIPLACARVTNAAAPVTGTTEPCGVVFDYTLSVARR